MSPWFHFEWPDSADSINLLPKDIQMDVRSNTQFSHLQHRQSDLICAGLSLAVLLNVLAVDLSRSVHNLIIRLSMRRI